MATLPSYVTILFDGFTEDFDPSVLRTEMDRGIPKQRVINSKVLAEINGQLLFKSKADAANFETWYFDTIKRIGWFDMKHPHTGVTISARFKGGNIGRLVPISPDFSWCTREVTFEYLR